MMLKEAYEHVKSQADSLRTMIQLRQPPFEGNVISTFDAMDGVLAMDGETTLNKTARMMKKAGAVKRSDGNWSLSPLRRKGYALKATAEWQAGDAEGRTAGRDTIYPFTKMEPDDAVSFPGEGFKGKAYSAAMVYGHRTGKKFAGRLWTEADGRTGIIIARVDGGVKTKSKPQVTDADIVKFQIDMKVGEFVYDIVRASDVVKTLKSVIPGITPVKAGLLLKQVPGARKVRAYDGKGQHWLWIIRDTDRISVLNGRKIWDLYKNERKTLSAFS